MDAKNLLYVCILLQGDCGDLSRRALADDTTALLRFRSFSLRDPPPAVQQPLFYGLLGAREWLNVVSLCFSGGLGCSARVRDWT